MRRIFRHSVGLLFVVLIAGGARSAVAQEIKLKLSHFASTAHNHHANVSTGGDEVLERCGLNAHGSD